MSIKSEEVRQEYIADILENREAAQILLAQKTREYHDLELQIKAGHSLHRAEEGAELFKEMRVLEERITRLGKELEIYSAK